MYFQCCLLILIAVKEICTEDDIPEVCVCVCVCVCACVRACVRVCYWRAL